MQFSRNLITEIVYEPKLVAAISFAHILLERYNFITFANEVGQRAAILKGRVESVDYK